MANRQVGVFGGTFDPIHLGHLNLAMELMEARGLDEVWFCPAQVNPFRIKERQTPAHHRLAMVHLATDDVPQFGVTNVELQRDGPSYMVDTLRHLVDDAAQGAPATFFLLLGEDCAARLEEWRQPHDILALATLLVGKRKGGDSAHLPSEPTLRASVEEALVPTRVVEISATQIRERLRNSQYCGHLLPAKVLNYIAAHGLYST